MSLRLFKYSSNWDFLKANNTAKYNGTDPPLHFMKTEAVFIRHKDKIMQTVHHTVKQLYEILRAEQYKDHTITSQQSWNNTFQRTLPWD